MTVDSPTGTALFYPYLTAPTPDLPCQRLETRMVPVDNDLGVDMASSSANMSRRGPLSVKTCEGVARQRLLACISNHAQQVLDYMEPQGIDLESIGEWGQGRRPVFDNLPELKNGAQVSFF
jgi:hypothetical protein